MRHLVAVVLCATAIAVPAVAHGDTIIQQKQAQLVRVKRQVHYLDLRVDRIDERYNAAVIRTHLLSRRIAATTLALKAAAARLRADQALLAELLVTAYKGQLTDDTYALMVGSDDFGAALNTYETRNRFDGAVADVVSQITEARAAIAARRRELLVERHDAAEAAQDLDRARRSIRHLLNQRRHLVRSLGQQILVATAAARIGEDQLALEARAWIAADLRARTRAGGPVAADRVALDGLSQIGVPYHWGGASPEAGFDCSGLVTWLWARQGVSLPHLASAQYVDGVHVSSTDLEIGDLLFFHELGHVAIYLGHGYVLHAPHTGDVVRIAPLAGGWFSATYVGATRISAA
jgi:cell wall-associated NlpC family hydrolase